MTGVVLVTGCSSGLGLATAHRFHAAGWQVAATMRTPSRGDELARLDRVLVTRLDVTDPDSIGRAVDDTIDRFGRIDVVVNNAGVGAHGLFEQYTDAEARQLYETNVFGTMNVVRGVLPLLRARRAGRIILVTSVAGLVGGPGTTIYSGTKFALEGFAESLSMDYAAWGIRVHTVAPGAFPTEFAASANDAWDRGHGEVRAHGIEVGAHMATVVEGMRTAGGRTAQPIEVADKILDCATSDMPLHNVVGADAEWLSRMLTTRPREDVLDHIRSALPALGDTGRAS